MMWLALYLIGAAGMALHVAHAASEDPAQSGWLEWAAGALMVAAWPAVTFAMVLAALSDR